MKIAESTHGADRDRIAHGKKRCDIRMASDKFAGGLIARLQGETRFTEQGRIIGQATIFESTAKAVKPTGERIPGYGIGTEDSDPPMPQIQQLFRHQIAHSTVINRDGGRTGQRKSIRAYGREHHGKIQALNDLGPLIHLAADKNESQDPGALQHMQSCQKFIFALVDIFSQKSGRSRVSPVQNCFGKRIQKRIGTPPDDQADDIVGLLEFAGIAVADKMMLTDNTFHMFPGIGIDIRAMIQHPADRCHRDTGQSGNIPDGQRLHSLAASSRMETIPVTFSYGQ